jgi:hypothetical protein
MFAQLTFQYLRGGEIGKWGISIVPGVMTLKSNFNCSCYTVYEVEYGKIDLLSYFLSGNKARYYVQLQKMT